ncbi:hypothetical protein OGAPHI_006120 [Ogataea philodendri]|uniref:Uncharacterized protein n=1 Tax=Ogataea philodendri TaxID=1378263 RepID=A0A9P8T1Q8_9ASCO|nr:uncharacterized protein OGAPHI_006120 [Ogataea philodendri]KAH3661941.1 hypothetical protein OGAPHI_006120 [Ogataea philodendri]
MMVWTGCGDLAVFGPLVLASDGGFFLRSEVVDDVERFADLFRRLAADHLSNDFAAGVEQRLDVEVIGCEDDLVQHFLVHVKEVLVPGVDRGALLGVVVLLVVWEVVVFVVVAPFQNVLHHSRPDVLCRHLDWLVGVLVVLFLVVCRQQVFQHILDEDTFFGDLALHRELVAVGSDDYDLSFGHGKTNRRWVFLVLGVRGPRQFLCGGSRREAAREGSSMKEGGKQQDACDELG